MWASISERSANIVLLEYSVFQLYNKVKILGVVGQIGSTLIARRYRVGDHNIKRIILSYMKWFS